MEPVLIKISRVALWIITVALGAELIEFIWNDIAKRLELPEIGFAMSFSIAALIAVLMLKFC